MGDRKNNQRFDKFPAQTLIEFVLVLPILLLLIFGAMDLGRMFYVKVALTNAAREGANYLAYHPDELVSGLVSGNFPNAFEAIEVEAESLGVDIDTTTEVNISAVCSHPMCTGDELEVQISKSYDLLLGNLLATLGLTNGPLTLTSTIAMVVQ